MILLDFPLLAMLEIHDDAKDFIIIRSAMVR